MLGLPIKDAREIISCLARLGFTFDAPELLNPELLMQGLEEFRQHLGGRLTVTMLQAIGQPVDVHTIDEAVMLQSIRQLAEVGLPSVVDG